MTSDTNSVYSLSYDEVDRIITVDITGTTGVPNVVLTYAYDLIGNVLSVSDDSGVTVSSTYDESNLLISRDWSGGGINEARYEIDYTDARRRSEIRRFSDVLGSQQLSRSSFDYDERERLTAISHLDVVDAAIAEYEYTYDLADRVTQAIHSGDTDSFVYDENGQIIQADHTSLPHEAFTYDSAGNRTDNGKVCRPVAARRQDPESTSYRRSRWRSSAGQTRKRDARRPASRSFPDAGSRWECRANCLNRTSRRSAKSGSTVGWSIQTGRPPALPCA